MCRLSGVTATTRALGIDTGVLMHEMMLRSSTEEGGQRDGWGIADSKASWRSALWYVESAPHYLPSIDRDEMLIGHVRKRSTGTGTTANENHPYIFTVGDQSLIAAHNGWIDGVDWAEWQQGAPQTDSWRALNDLATILRDENAPDISPDIVNRWLSAYTSASHYAFLIKWNGKMHAIRGKTRTLNVLEIAGQGWLINTSAAVLRTMKEYLRTVEGIDSGDVLYIKDNNMLVFEADTPGYDYYVIEPQHKTKVYTNTQSAWTGAGNNSWRNDPKPAATVVKSDDDGGREIIIAPSVTTPRKGQATVVTALTALPNSDVAAWRAKEWSKTAGLLSPLPKELSALWALHSLGFVKNHQYNVDLLAVASVADLDMFYHMVIRDDGAKPTKPFTPMSTRMINWWNHCVRGNHADVHMRLFDSKFFWLDADYVTAPEENIVTAYLNWQRYLALTILQAYTDDKELRATFNTGKVFSVMKAEVQDVDTDTTTDAC